MVASSTRRAPDRIALRLLQMLDGIEYAGFSPIGFVDLHGYAYIANLLAPLWDVDPLDGKVLKEGRPYYPELRQAVDRMVLLGLVELIDYKPSMVSGKWEAEGFLATDSAVVRPLLDRLDMYSDERRIRDFLRRLAIAIAPSSAELRELVTKDVTWTDNRTGRGDVIDFAEWRDANYSLNATLAFDRVMPPALRPSKGEALQYYVHLLERRAGSQDES